MQKPLNPERREVFAPGCKMPRTMEDRYCQAKVRRPADSLVTITESTQYVRKPPKCRSKPSATLPESVSQIIAKKREKTAHKFVVFAAIPVSLKIRA
jgi:hypothetical protein